MRVVLGVALLLAGQPLAAQQQENYDYFDANRTLIRNGVQSLLMCNGLFTSNRSVKQVFAQELAYLKTPVGTARRGEYEIDRDLRMVSVGGLQSGTAVRSVFREGLGCVVMAPDQGLGDIDSLPQIETPKWEGDVSRLAWPMGDRTPKQPLTAGVDSDALQAASDWAFERDTAEQDTISLIVVHQGQIIHERYAKGFDVGTRTRTWSTAKSIAATLIGMLVDDGVMALDEPLDIDWLPAVADAGTDPRGKITLRNVLNMSSGLYPVDSFGMEYATGSGLAYWAGASSIDGARRRGLIRDPGAHWDYENYDTLLAVYAMKLALGDAVTYTAFPHTALFERIGMRNTLVSTDRFGDFIFSSQVYTNARDLARFGLLYLQDGVWQGERLLSSEWINFVRTPAPSTQNERLHGFYGGQFWLVPDDRDDVPASAYATAGNRGQYVVIVPTHDLVIVRRGLDYAQQGFNRWDLTREVLKAFAVEPDVEPD